MLRNRHFCASTTDKNTINPPKYRKKYQSYQLFFFLNIYTNNVIPLLLDTNMSKILIIYSIIHPRRSEILPLGPISTQIQTPTQLCQQILKSGSSHSGKSRHFISNNHLYKYNSPQLRIPAIHGAKTTKIRSPGTFCLIQIFENVPGGSDF